MGVGNPHVAAAVWEHSSSGVFAVDANGVLTLQGDQTGNPDDVFQNAAE